MSRCRKDGETSAPMAVELVATPEAGSDARLRRAMEMVLAAAARQSQQMDAATDEKDTSQEDVPTL